VCEGASDFASSSEVLVTAQVYTQEEDARSAEARKAQVTLTVQEVRDGLVGRLDDITRAHALLFENLNSCLWSFEPAAVLVHKNMC